MDRAFSCRVLSRGESSPIRESRSSRTRRAKMTLRTAPGDSAGMTGRKTPARYKASVWLWGPPMYSGTWAERDRGLVILDKLFHLLDRKYKASAFTVRSTLGHQSQFLQQAGHAPAVDLQRRRKADHRMQAPLRHRLAQQPARPAACRPAHRHNGSGCARAGYRAQVLGRSAATDGRASRRGLHTLPRVRHEPLSPKRLSVSRRAPRRPRRRLPRRCGSQLPMRNSYPAVTSARGGRPARAPGQSSAFPMRSAPARCCVHPASQSDARTKAAHAAKQDVGRP